MTKYPALCRRCHFRLPARYSDLCQDCREINDPSHPRKHRERIIPCDRCERMFKDRHGLADHQDKAHGIVNPF